MSIIVKSSAWTGRGPTYEPSELRRYYNYVASVPAVTAGYSLGLGIVGITSSDVAPVLASVAVGFSSGLLGHTAMGLLSYRRVGWISKIVADITDKNPGLDMTPEEFLESAAQNMRIAKHAPSLD